MPGRRRMGWGEEVPGAEFFVSGDAGAGRKGRTALKYPGKGVAEFSRGGDGCGGK